MWFGENLVSINCLQMETDDCDELNATIAVAFFRIEWMEYFPYISCYVEMLLTIGFDYRRFRHWIIGDTSCSQPFSC